MRDGAPVEAGTAATASCFTIERQKDASAPAGESATKVPPSLYGVMAATTLTTFVTLTGSYQLFFY